MSAPKVTVASLGTPDKDGFMTKQGGTWKTWKRRWFVLKGKKLYYFKTKQDPDATGVIDLNSQSTIKNEGTYRGKRFCFSIATPGQRVFYMYPNTENEAADWVKALSANVGGGTPSSPGSSQPVRSEQPAGSPSSAKSEPVQEIAVAKPAFASDEVRKKLDAAKDSIGFLHEDDSKVLEFWTIWTESIPPPEELVDGGQIVFEVAASADMEKLNWRAHGPQNIFIQRMVDFFWNVGAPETEIDRLNDVGALINPITIGSWIDMSAKGGMDGGWYFPVDVLIKFAIEACDPGDPINRVANWAEANGVTRCNAVGRDMGAAPPRQTEIVFSLPGDTFEEQLDKALSAYTEFGFPAIVDDALQILRENGTPGLTMTVITSSEGFVRLGLLAPNPNRESVVALCELSGAGSGEQLFKLENCLGVDGPDMVEYQYLMEGFGYGVYKEGFDVVFHYKLIS